MVQGDRAHRLRAAFLSSSLSATGSLDASDSNKASDSAAAQCHVRDFLLLGTISPLHLTTLSVLLTMIPKLSLTTTPLFFHTMTLSCSGCAVSLSPHIVYSTRYTKVQLSVFWTPNVKKRTATARPPSPLPRSLHRDLI